MEDRWSSVRRFEGRDEDRPSRKKGKKEEKKTRAPQSPSRRRRDAAQIFRGSLF